MSVETILNWAVHTGISVSLLIVLVLLVRRPFTRKFGARAAYWLWALPLIRIVLPEVPLTINLPNWLASAPKPLSETVVPLQFEAAAYSPVAALINWQAPLLVVWLVVATIWLAAQIMRQHKFLKSIRETSLAAPKSVQIQAAEICRTLNISVPDIRLATTNMGPLVTGMFRPVIILPQNFEEDFNRHQQFFALIHELAHIKRRDIWAAFGALLFRALNWPNPLVHLAATKFRIDQEAACDAYVLTIMGGGVRTKQNYAATLIHSAKLTKTPTPTPSPNVQTVQTSPLSLTIYHPLKERLMTLKTSKTNSTMLSRIGAGALLVTALAMTAPVTIAVGQDSDTPKAQTKMTKVMKMVENVDGVETTKHIEINTVDGVTTAYSIDEHGNKTAIDVADIQTEIQMAGGTGEFEDMNIFVMDGGEAGKKRVKIIMGGNMENMAGQHMLHKKNGEGGHSQIIVKRMTKDADGNIVEIGNDVMVMAQSGHNMHASSMVGAAQKLLNQAEVLADEKELSAKTRRKLDKARKALKEAQAALAAEE